MTPRDIQLRIRSGDSLADVIAASGLPAARVEAFAAPIIAEREHTTTTALAAPVRRRGETASARRLRKTVAEALLDRGQDIDFVTWDSWRRSDGRWIIQGTWTHQKNDQCARFLFDPKGRFSIADNDQARLLVGDLPLARPKDFEAETTEQVEQRTWLVQTNLAEETTLGLAEETTLGLSADDEDSLRSDIDLLYDMISTIDEDSVRIFRGLREPLPSSQESSLHPRPAPMPEPVKEPVGVVAVPPEPVTDDEDPTPARKRKRASVPAWDDIIFGGRS